MHIVCMSLTKRLASVFVKMAGYATAIGNLADDKFHLAAPVHQVRASRMKVDAIHSLMDNVSNEKKGTLALILHIAAKIQT